MQTFIPKGIYANNFDVSGRMLSSAAGMDSQKSLQNEDECSMGPCFPPTPDVECAGC